MGDNRSAESYFDTSVATDGEVNAHSGSFAHVDDLESFEIAEGLFFRPLFAQNVSLNFVVFPPQSGFPSHTHPEEQISIVSEGEMEFTIGDSSLTVRPGDIVVVPPDVPHSGRTIDESCRLIDIFSPSRTGIKDVIASADPVRTAAADQWWYDREIAPEATPTVS